MMINVSKYHGLGNDFVFASAKDVLGVDESSFAKAVCNRHTGIGADGLIIVVEKPLTMVYYNSDGSRAKMCGNGIRCFAKYCFDHQLIQQNTFDVETLAGIYHLSILEENPFMVTVNMGKPNYTSSAIPMSINKDVFVNEDIVIDEKKYCLTSLLMGATHTVIEVNDLEDTDLISIGSSIQYLDIYPDSTNVNFYQKISDNKVKMQTYERGAGLTLACGTGATAVYAVLRDYHNFQGELECELPLGSLFLDSDEAGNILMSGPAAKIFEGSLRW